MFRGKKISVVIPSYNEVVGIKHIFERKPAFIDEVIVVDSHSTDGTDEIAKTFGAKVITIQKRGYGRAYKEGFKHITGDIVVTMDADGTYPIDEKEISPLIDKLLDENIDFISCCRFPLQYREAMAQRSVFANNFMAFFANILFRAYFCDLLSGMWIFRTEILPKLKLESNLWNFSEEIKIEAYINKDVNFRELPIIYRGRIGKSKVFEQIYNPIKIGALNFLFLFKKRVFR
ncbi:MAG: glycosyltransferase family 2 protein [Elusimicrobiota bacterium]|nr:glycosyltransferase family 2 protein [Elusimicrobiota bacterium]